MSRSGQRRVLILLSAVLLCLVMARVSYGNRLGAEGGFTLWYAKSDCPASVMEDLIGRCRRETGLAIQLTAYPDEKALGAAFESGRPDLLFCSHIRAGSLRERGHLSEIAEPVPLPDAPRAAGEWVGSAFFPLGSRLPLLLTDTARTEGDFASLEALLKAAGDAPFFTADDWGALLFTALYAEGASMTGTEEDEQDPAYQTMYNTLAEAAFRGGLVAVEGPAAEYVRQGLLPCAAVEPGSLAGMKEQGLKLSLLPLPEGAEEGQAAELMGFALLEGADTDAAQSFARWLCTATEGGSAALKAGLIPAYPDTVGQTALEKSLAQLAKSEKLCYPASDTAYYTNRTACAGRLYAALDLLN